MCEDESVGKDMRVLGVMALPLLLLAFDFWLLYDAGLDGYSYGKETGRKQRGFVLYLIISAILLLVLAGRLIWDCPEQSILFQCKRVSCLAMLFVAAATDYRFW